MMYSGVCDGILPAGDEIDRMGVHVALHVLAHQQHVAELAEVRLQVRDRAARPRIREIEGEMNVLAGSRPRAD